MKKSKNKSKNKREKVKLNFVFVTTNMSTLGVNLVFFAKQAIEFTACPMWLFESCILHQNCPLWQGKANNSYEEAVAKRE